MPATSATVAAPVLFGDQHRPDILSRDTQQMAPQTGSQLNNEEQIVRKSHPTSGKEEEEDSEQYEDDEIYNDSHEDKQISQEESMLVDKHKTTITQIPAKHDHSNLIEMEKH